MDRRKHFTVEILEAQVLQNLDIVDSPKCHGGFLEEFSARLGVKTPAAVVQQAL